MMGRRPVNQPAIWAAIQSSPADGLDYARIVEISGLCPSSVKDALWKMRAAGKVPWLKRGAVLLHFGSPELRDAYDAANPAAVTRVRRRGSGGNGRQPRAPRILAAIPQAGARASEIERTTGIGSAHVRRILADLERSGEAFRYGTKQRLTWFKSREDLERARPVIDAAMLRHSAEVVLKRSKAGVARSVQSKQRGEKVLTKRANADGLSRSAPNAVQERREVDIIGFDEAKKKCKPAEKYPDHRFVVTGPVVGGWATMGVGRYIE